MIARCLRTSRCTRRRPHYCFLGFNVSAAAVAGELYRLATGGRDVVEHAVAKCRHLDVTLYDNGDVGYCFYRHNFTGWRRYLIEYPTESVLLANEAELMASGATVSRTAEGWVALNWPEGRPGPPDLPIRYEKRGLLKAVLDHRRRHRWKYDEVFRIKAGGAVVFYLQLHGPDRRLSAVARSSSAWFRGGPGVDRYLSPRELASASFASSGVLRIDWLLDDGDVSAKAWPPSRARPAEPSAADPARDIGSGSV